MEPVTTIAEANRAMRRYLVQAEGVLADDTFARFEALVDAPVRVPAIGEAAELLFARRDELDAAGRELAIALAAFIGSIGNFELGQDGGVRAAGVVRTLRGELAEGEAAPEPLARVMREPVGQAGE